MTDIEIDKKKVPELPHLTIEDLTDDGIEIYAGILLLSDLLKQADLNENFRIRCSNLRNHWIGLLCF